METTLSRVSAGFKTLGVAIEAATEATKTLQGTLDKIAKRRRKARWPIYPVLSRKQRLRRLRTRRRAIARQMHKLQGEYIQCIVRGDKADGAKLTAESAAYLCESVARFTVLRFFESRFSGPRSHVLRKLNAIIRRGKNGHPPLTGESGHAALRHSFLARRDAERARLNKLQAAMGEGTGFIV